MQPSHPDTTRAATEAAQPATVLIIDDDQHIRTLIGRVVRRIGYVTLEASDGQDGIALFERHRDVIGCVVLDLYMPVFAGPFTFHQLREADRNLPIVLISGNHEDLAQLALQSPLTALLQKPFTVNELRETIQRLMGPQALSVPAKTGA